MSKKSASVYHILFNWRDLMSSANLDLSSVRAYLTKHPEQASPDDPVIAMWIRNSENGVQYTINLSLNDPVSQRMLRIDDIRVNSLFSEENMKEDLQIYSECGEVLRSQELINLAARMEKEQIEQVEADMLAYQDELSAVVAGAGVWCAVDEETKTQAQLTLEEGIQGALSSSIFDSYEDEMFAAIINDVPEKVKK